MCHGRRYARLLCIGEVISEIVILVLCYNLFDYMYVPKDDWSRVMWKSFYSQDNIDDLYLGSSHVYMDINPAICDAYNDSSSFNMATGAQTLQESYFNLIEANKHYNLKNVYLELYYSVSTGELGDYSSKEAMMVSWRSTDFMNNSINRWEAINEMNDESHILDAFLPLIRYREYLFNWNHITDTVDHKQTDDYKNYKYHYEKETGYTEHQGKGYLYSSIQYKPKVLEDLKQDISLSKDAEKYLRKIIEYCQKKGLRIVLFASPMQDVLLMHNSYDIYVDAVNKIADEYGVPYYDFNLCKREYLRIPYPNGFFDTNHLNCIGAEIFTRFFCKIVNQTEEENRKYFYNSYREKIEDSDCCLYGICKDEIIEEQTDNINKSGGTYVLEAGGKSEMEFKIELEGNYGEGTTNVIRQRKMVQDFSSNRMFTILANEHGMCRVTWRVKDIPDKETVREFEY